jgi:D-threo-aldose 1-dehydrogenase
MIAHDGVDAIVVAVKAPDHPLVASVIPGARSAAEVENNISLLSESIPAEFWAELKAEKLMDERAPVKSSK